MLDMRRMDRFWSKVHKGPDCWTWTAATDLDGYGVFWTGKKMRGAHRIAYKQFVGQIPDGLQIDHLCRNRNCVNPTHMEVVTPRENNLRGDGLRTLLAARINRIHRIVMMRSNGSAAGILFFLIDPDFGNE